MEEGLQGAREVRGRLKLRPLKRTTGDRNDRGEGPSTQQGRVVRELQNDGANDEGADYDPVRAADETAVVSRKIH